MKYKLYFAKSEPIVIDIDNSLFGLTSSQWDKLINAINNNNGIKNTLEISDYDEIEDEEDIYGEIIKIKLE